ncbi:MAG TPA: cation diffusion facilitator family transporter [Candidatus Sulfopaludibacter sp.]|nr:cation diffusion facilitator family transporter [Candidatus Sulfopaludibacter sp.]
MGQESGLHSHAHHHRNAATGSVLGWSTVATAAFVAIEVTAGIRAHSLALISDAGHNLTDALALLLAWFGVYLQSRPADETRTYGYHRAGVLSAFVNAITLVAVSAWILFEAVERLRQPQQVAEGTMLVVAVLGLLLNGGVMLALRRDRRHDLNIRSAFVHMLGDALGSIAIVAGALVIRYTGWVQVDPALSMAIACLIVWTAWDIVRESLNILLEGLPRGISLQDVTSGMREVEGVLDVHDLHIWSLGSSTHALSCHVLIDDIPPSASDAVLRGLNGMLAERFHIAHTTVQFEHVNCAISETGCAIPVRQDHEGHGHRH